MRQMNAPVNKPIVATQNAEDILGQFYFAFGQGAGTTRVSRAAIAALRTRYLPNIRAARIDWNEVSGNVLSLVSQVGRLSALLATQAGRTAISEADFTQARVAVEGNVHRQKEEAGLMAGPFCCKTPGEVVPVTPEPSADLPLVAPGLSEADVQSPLVN